jgi:hypothetical protein
MLKVLKALKALAVGAALAPFLVGSADAHDPHHTAGDGGLVYSAIVELGGGWLLTSNLQSDADNRIDDSDFGVVEGAARASIPLGSNASFQFDLDGMHGITAREQSGDDALQGFFFTSAHLTLRGSSIGALGILGSYGQAYGGDSDNAQVWFGGGEAQLYLGPVTLYAQGGYMQADDGSEGDVITNAYWARAAARVFFTPNARLQLEAAYTEGEENDDFDEDVIRGYAAGLRFDHAPGGGPVSYFIGYQGSFIENEDNDAQLADHTGLVGIGLRLGAENLRDEDRRGATLDTPAWAMGRWTGWSIDVLD